MDHLLRTLAAVPPRARVLLAGDVPPDANVALDTLGFDTTVASGAEALGQAASGESDRYDWIAAWIGPSESLDGIAKQLEPGAWAWVSVRTPDLPPEALTHLAAEAGLALSERPASVGEGSTRSIRGIYRRVDERTTG